MYRCKLWSAVSLALPPLAATWSVSRWGRVRKWDNLPPHYSSQSNRAQKFCNIMRRCWKGPVPKSHREGVPMFFCVWVNGTQDLFHDHSNVTVWSAPVLGRSLTFPRQDIVPPPPRLLSSSWFVIPCKNGLVKKTNTLIANSIARKEVQLRRS